MKRKVMCFVLSLLLVLTAFPFAASAAESYGIVVEGTEITSENAADVFGDGTVSFNPENGTLTLNGANIGGAKTKSYITGIYIAREEETVINVVSESKIHIKSDEDAVRFGVYSENGVRFTGEMLEVIIYSSKDACGVYSENGVITFENCKAYIDATYATRDGIGVWGIGGITFDNAEVRIFGTTESVVFCGALTFANGFYIKGTNEATAESPAYEYFVFMKPKPPADDGETPSPEDDEEIIDTDTDKTDVKGASFLPLMLKATAKARTITLTWKRVKGADGYIIYGSRCGQKLKKIKTLNSGAALKFRHKKLKKGKYYKYVAVAYKNTNGGKKTIAKSLSVHCKTYGGTKGNPTGIKLKTKKLSINNGKSKTLRPILVSKKKVDVHIARFRYESSDKSVVTVNKKGKITAKKKGTAYIYVIAQNGIYKRVKISVK